MAIRIRFKCGIAGERYSYRPGQAAVWTDEAEAQRFIRDGIAELVTDVPPPPSTRTATAKPAAEKATIDPPANPPVTPAAPVHTDPAGDGAKHAAPAQPAAGQGEAAKPAATPKPDKPRGGRAKKNT